MGNDACSERTAVGQPWAHGTNWWHLLPGIWLGELDGAHPLRFQIVLSRAQPAHKMFCGVGLIVRKHPGRGITGGFE